MKQLTTNGIFSLKGLYSPFKGTSHLLMLISLLLQLFWNFWGTYLELLGNVFWNFWGTAGELLGNFWGFLGLFSELFRHFFLFCLGLSLGSILIKDMLPLISISPEIDQILSFEVLFNEPISAGLFLLLPYISMISLDIHSRRQEREIEKRVKRLKSE